MCSLSCWSNLEVDGKAFKCERVSGQYLFPSVVVDTGYSVVRSLSEAPFYAAAIAKALGQNSNADSLGVGQNSREAAIEGASHLTRYSFEQWHL